MEETEDDLSQVEQIFLSSSAQGIRDLQKWNEQSFIRSSGNKVGMFGAGTF
jgi:hypothetical protein